MASGILKGFSCFLKMSGWGSLYAHFRFTCSARKVGHQSVGPSILLLVDRSRQTKWLSRKTEEGRVCGRRRSFSIRISEVRLS